MTDSDIEDHLPNIFAESRKLSLAYKQDFINYDHMFLVILKTGSLKPEYLDLFDVAAWETKIQELYGTQGVKKHNDSLPLTILAERVVRHAQEIAWLANQSPVIYPVHLLLAILSFNNGITKAFKQAGVLIEDITMTYFKVAIKSFPTILKPIREVTYSKIALLLMTAAAKNKKQDKLYSNAIALFSYGQFYDVLKVCSVALHLSPANLRFEKLRCQCYLKLLDFEKALELVTSLISKNPGDEMLQFLLAYIHMKLGSYNEAETMLDRFLLAEPENSIHLNNKGFNLSNQQKYQESIPLFEKSIQHDPKMAYAWNNLGFAKYKMGQLDQGINDIDTSLELDKGNSFAYRNKGIIYIELRDTQLAKSNLELALKYGYTEKYGNEAKEWLAQLT